MIHGKHKRTYIPTGFSTSAISWFRSIESKYDLYKSKGCKKTFCELLREHAVKIINFEKKKIKLITKEQEESYENTKICYICKKKLKINIWMIKIYRKVRDNCHYTGEYRGAVHSICNLKHSAPKNFPIVFS